MTLSKPNPISTQSSEADPFHPENLRIDQSQLENPGVKKLITTVLVRKPSKQEFIRVHNGENYRRQYAMIELKAEREWYLVSRSVAQALPNEVVYPILHLAISLRWPACSRSCCRGSIFRERCSAADIWRRFQPWSTLGSRLMFQCLIDSARIGRGFKIN
jgi:hypothetical protein